MVGNSTKLASSGPVAAPIVLNRVARPVLFIRSPTLIWTRATIAGNKIPDSNETGNIKAKESRPISRQESRLKGPALGRTAAPGKNKYERSVVIPARSNKTGSSLLSRATPR